MPLGSFFFFNFFLLSAQFLWGHVRGGDVLLLILGVLLSVSLGLF